MRFFSFVRKGKTETADADLEHAYALIDRISNYIENNDYLRASEGYVELEGLYKELKAGKGDVYEKCAELHHKINQLQISSPGVKIKINKIIEEPNIEREGLSNELLKLSNELLKYKNENESMHSELKEIKDQLVSKGKDLEELNKLIEGERKQYDENIKELEKEIKDLKKIKENYENEIKGIVERYEEETEKLRERYEEDIEDIKSAHDGEIKKIRDMYEKEIERLNLEIGELEVKSGDVKKPMFFEFFAKKKKTKSSGLIVNIDSKEAPDKLPELDFEREIKI